MSEMSLLERVAAIAQQLADEDHLDGLLQRVVDLGHAEIDGCDGVSMMMIRKGGLVSTPAYSSPVARDSDLAQYEADEGPCLEAIRAHQTVIIDDLATETRWPGYRARALELGVRAMISFRLFVHEDTIGALDFYSTTPHAFDRAAQLYGQVFASHAAVAMKAAITQGGMAAALQSRDTIGQAKGILMERESLTAAAAFERLRALSQQHHTLLRDLAEEITRTGIVPDD